MLFHIILPLLFVGLNVYVGWRCWQGLKAWLPGFRLWIFIPVYALLVTPFLLERLGESFFSDSVNHYISMLGMFMLVAVLYAAMICLVIDIGRIINRFHPFLNPDRNYVKALGPIVLLLLAGVLGYGYWNARTAVVTRYDINTAKSAGDLHELRIVAVSDIHAGSIINNGRILALADEINALQPDIVLLPGDIVDQSVSRLAEENLADSFARIKSRYGTYACPGNHEHLDGNEPGSVVAYLKQGNIEMLSDQAVLIDNSFYVIGRADSREFFSSDDGSSMTGLVQDLDRSKPLIVMDHKPARYADAAAQGVDLLLSGHTHAGQFWPVTMITPWLSINDYGYYQEGSFQAVVTSGWGTWGPPVRVGSHSEIVLITLHFK